MTLTPTILLLATAFFLSVSAQEQEGESSSQPMSTATATVTLSAPLATSLTSTPAASSSSSSSLPLTTAIPFVNLDGIGVPFLLQRPIDGNQLQSTSESSNSNSNKVKSSKNGTPLTPDIYFSGCDDSDSVHGIVDSNLRVNVSAIYVQLDGSSSSSGEGVQGGQSQAMSIRIKHF